MFSLIIFLFFLPVFFRASMWGSFQSYTGICGHALKLKLCIDSPHSCGPDVHLPRNVTAHCDRLTAHRWPANFGVPSTHELIILLFL